jgi:hypothetical protein
MKDMMELRCSVQGMKPTVGVFGVEILFYESELKAWSVQSAQISKHLIFSNLLQSPDRLCGLVVRVLGYRSGGPGSIPGTTRKKNVGLERGALSLVSTNWGATW